MCCVCEVSFTWTACSTVCFVRLSLFNSISKAHYLHSARDTPGQMDGKLYRLCCSQRIIQVTLISLSKYMDYALCVCVCVTYIRGFRIALSLLLAYSTINNIPFARRMHLRGPPMCVLVRDTAAVVLCTNRNSILVLAHAIYQSIHKMEMDV